MTCQGPCPWASEPYRFLAQQEILSQTTGRDLFRALFYISTWKILRPGINGSLNVSAKLHTYPSPKPTFFPRREVSVNAGLGEGKVRSFSDTYYDPYKPVHTTTRSGAETAPIRDDPLPRSARRSIIPLQILSPNHGSFVWRKTNPIWFLCRHKS